jgi:16S rRNA processing protein RimM
MIVLGRIVAPYGLHGWVRVHPFGDDPDRWREMPHWWLGTVADGESGDWLSHTLEDSRVHGKDLIAKFEGIDDRTAAETIDGRYIAVPREALPRTATDEYYWADLIGLEVINSEGMSLGKVTGMLAASAHDVLCVGDLERERLLPFVAAVIKDVNTESRVMRVDWSSEW